VEKHAETVHDSDILSCFRSLDERRLLRRRNEIYHPHRELHVLEGFFAAESERRRVHDRVDEHSASRPRHDSRVPAIDVDRSRDRLGASRIAIRDIDVVAMLQ